MPTMMKNIYRITLLTNVENMATVPSERIVEADDVEILPNGALVFHGDALFVDPRCSESQQTSLIWFAPGTWVLRNQDIHRYHWLRVVSLAR
jgi:hypothetical protein